MGRLRSADASNHLLRAIHLSNGRLQSGRSGHRRRRHRARTRPAVVGLDGAGNLNGGMVIVSEGELPAAQGKTDGEGCADSLGALHVDRSPVSLDDVLDGGQPHSGSVDLAHDALAAMEALEYARQVLGG